MGKPASLAGIDTAPNGSCGLVLERSGSIGGKEADGGAQKSNSRQRSEF